MPPYLARLSTLTGLNYPCLELIFMVPKVFEPLTFDCIAICVTEYCIIIMRIGTHVTSLTMSMSAMCFLIEIMFFLKVIKSHFKES